MDISTWTAARAEVAEIAGMRNHGEILEMRWLVDLTFVRRDPQAADLIRRTFGTEAIRVANCHAKFALFHNGAWNLVLRSSMNLNMNPRTEDFTLSNDLEIFEFIKSIMERIWQRQKKSMTDQKPYEVVKHFQREL